MRISDWSSDVCSSDLLPAIPDLLSPFCGKAGFSPFMILSFLNFHVCSLPVPALQSGSLPLNLMASTGGITRSGKHKVSYGHGLLRIAIPAKYRRPRGKWHPRHGGKNAQSRQEENR